MKKILIVLTICLLFASMSVVTAFSKIEGLSDDILNTEITYQPTDEDWTGEFIGALGVLKRINGEWNFTTGGYIAGVYKGLNRGKFAGNLYNLNETKVGTIAGYYGRGLILARMTINEQKAPVVGFIRYNETMFIGRAMTVIGPAPHMVGYHWTN